jgi:hypothetical protein
MEEKCSDWEDEVVCSRLSWIKLVDMQDKRHEMAAGRQGDMGEESKVDKEKERARDEESGLYVRSRLYNIGVREREKKQSCSRMRSEHLLLALRCTERRANKEIMHSPTTKRNLLEITVAKLKGANAAHSTRTLDAIFGTRGIGCADGRDLVALVQTLCAHKKRFSNLKSLS